MTDLDFNEKDYLNDYVYITLLESALQAIAIDKTRETFNNKVDTYINNKLQVSNQTLQTYITSLINANQRQVFQNVDNIPFVYYNTGDLIFPNVHYSSSIFIRDTAEILLLQQEDLKYYVHTAFVMPGTLVCQLFNDNMAKNFIKNDENNDTTIKPAYHELAMTIASEIWYKCEDNRLASNRKQRVKNVKNQPEMNFLIWFYPFKDTPPMFFIQQYVALTHKNIILIPDIFYELEVMWKHEWRFHVIKSFCYVRIDDLSMTFSLGSLQEHQHKTTIEKVIKIRIGYAHLFHRWYEYVRQEMAETRNVGVYSYFLIRRAFEKVLMKDFDAHDACKHEIDVIVENVYADSVVNKDGQPTTQAPFNLYIPFNLVTTCLHKALNDIKVIIASKSKSLFNGSFNSIIYCTNPAYRSAYRLLFPTYRFLKNMHPYKCDVQTLVTRLGAYTLPDNKDLIDIVKIFQYSYVGQTEIEDWENIETHFNLTKKTNLLCETIAVPYHFNNQPLLPLNDDVINQFKKYTFLTHDPNTAINVDDIKDSMLFITNHVCYSFMAKKMNEMLPYFFKPATIEKSTLAHINNSFGNPKRLISLNIMPTITSYRYFFTYLFCVGIWYNARNNPDIIAVTARDQQDFDEIIHLFHQHFATTYMEHGFSSKVVLDFFNTYMHTTNLKSQ